MTTKNSSKAGNPKPKQPKVPKKSIAKASSGDSVSCSGAKRPVGRPTDYSPEVAERIISGLVQGNSLRTLCEAEDMPCKATVFMWLYKHPEFLDQYRIAREAQALALEDEINDIADDGRNDWMDKLNGKGEVIGQMVNMEAVLRSKLRVDTRRWLLERMQPKRFGNKVELTGKDGGAIQHAHEVRVVKVPNKEQAAVDTKPLGTDGRS